MRVSNVQADVVSFNATISACEKRARWKEAFAVFAAMLAAKVEATEVSFQATISACVNSGQWQQALGLFQSMPDAKVLATLPSFNPTIIACEQGGQRQQLLSLLGMMQHKGVHAFSAAMDARVSIRCLRTKATDGNIAGFCRGRFKSLRPGRTC
ncbi:unnamed protein product [Effrenium voratum]|nr:unnamed protein product [Effrenium voratum]